MNLEQIKEYVSEHGGEAVEWISYNTVRSLPYVGPMAPVILYPLDEEEI